DCPHVRGPPDHRGPRLFLLADPAGSLPTVDTLEVTRDVILEVTGMFGTSGPRTATPAAGRYVHSDPAGSVVSGKPAGSAPDPKIVVRHLYKVFRRGNRQVTALQDVSLEIAEGEFCVLIGPSG